ncbi:hypothetical protein K438DRAFT_1944022 [Mycena galopus ATCC 62051]|nr:hypothetical protein K438DRAFT_1944022 [Mycena galopus ATCC 62051]
MARFSVIFALFAASAAMAAPLHRRVAAANPVSQACDVDRLNIVTSFSATQNAVGAIGNSTDPATATAMTTAQTGLTSAADGIGKILLAIVTGVNPPSDAQPQVAAGLASAQTALASIKNPAVNTTDALAKVAVAIQNGKSIDQDCD